MSRGTRILAAAAVGAGAVATGRIVERNALRRLDRRPDQYAGEPFGSLRGTPVPVVASDGTPLYAEVDGLDRTDLAVVFSHGWTLSQDSWHFQRRALQGMARLVFWDHRGHGRSGGGRRSAYSLDQLPHDLAAVISATVPEGTPVVLVGHSMGGMTIQRYADTYPETIGSQVVAAALLCTSSGGLNEVSLGLPPTIARVAQRALPGGLKLAGAGASVLERVRHLGRDDARLILSAIAFGRGSSPAAIEFGQQMMDATRMDALITFFASMTGTQEISSCAELARMDTMVIGAERDQLTPLGHSLKIIAKCPPARLEVVPASGHMAMLERPAIVTDHIGDLIASARK